DGTAGDADADTLCVRVRGVADRRVSVSDERDRAELVTVAKHDAAVVVVDQPIQLPGERLEHLEVRNRANVAAGERGGARALRRTVVVDDALVLAARL